MNSSTSDSVFAEMERWEKGHIDIETMTKKVKDIEKENGCLKDKLAILERRIQVCNFVKIYNIRI